jgi:parallel beta-helix repeat protein
MPTRLGVSLKKNTFSKPQLLVFILAFAAIGAFILIKSFAASNPNLPGDLNNDNTVNALDLSLILSNYGTTNSAGDANSDNIVNALDLSVVLSHYGQNTIGQPTVTLTASPTTVNSGQSVTLTWTSTNSSNCFASGDWSGSKSTAGGNESVGPLATNSTFDLECSGPAGFANAQASVTVSGGGTIPACTGVTVNTTDNLQTLINNNANGTNFCIKTGVHRMTSAIQPKDSDIFVGENGAVLSGAKDISSGWSQSGATWFISNQTQGGTTGNLESDTSPAIKCITQPLCRYDNDVYFDDLPLQRVAALSSVSTGKFFFDYGNSRIYIGNDPTAHKIEAGVAPQLVDGLTHQVNNVKFYNLIIEKAANSSQVGAIQGYPTWTFHNLEVRYNHGTGLSDGGDVMYNNVHHNGQMGIGGSQMFSQYPTLATVFANNEVAYNNYANYSPGWEAGGSKWAFAHDTYVHDNYFHDNNGNGIWYDGSYGNNRIENNRVINNNLIGILYEVSLSVVIDNNTITGNGSSLINDSSTLTAGGINIANSQDVEIYGNSVLDNRDGIGLSEVSRSEGVNTQNVYVHNNTIRMPYASGHNGLIVWNLDYAYFTSKNNRFQANSYTIGCITKPFVWADPVNPGNNAGAFLTWAQWQAGGQDTTGTFTSSC